MAVKQWSLEWGGRTLTIETGKFALQTNASCTVRYGDTVILATAVISKQTRPGIDFFPLMVNFEEKLYAAGKIKGSRFIKREGRPTDDAVLSGRLVDRAIRPLFPTELRNDVQVILTALSYDTENDPQVPALIAASTALALSSIPWAGPIAGARVGRVDGAWVLNPKVALRESGEADIIIAGTPERIIMVEAGCKEIPDADVLAALRFGADSLGPILSLIKQIAAEAGQPKVNPVPEKPEQAAQLPAVEQAVRALIAGKIDAWMFDRVKPGRAERVAMVERFGAAVREYLTGAAAEPEIAAVILGRFKHYLEEHVTERILSAGTRLDGRALTDIRPLQIEVGLLPRTHGSGLFQRGDTQVLSTVTLGAPGDVQTLDTMEEEGTKRYMHHYSDTPASYGETGPLRGPGNRAIGHGALAERALQPVLPAQEAFPYAIRVVSEVLGSNGSSSMASVCGSTLALLDAGVPVQKPVAGIAMGLASNAAGQWRVLTDLQDIEDGPGGMDFKIAGTRDGITAIQMDTKTHGLTWEVVEQTFRQSQAARGQLLDAIAQVIAAPRPELSPYAPRIVTIHINPDKIRDVIGPGGKMINKIIAETGVDIDIEDDGTVFVTSDDAAGMERAVKWIEELTHEVQPGEQYEGTVVRLEDFGAFVQVLPGQDGLVHVSEISWSHVPRPSDVLKLGDKVKVVVREIDNLGRINLSIKQLLPKPEGWTPPPRPAFDRGNRPPHRGFGGGRGGFRNGR
ncbi:MAG: polyribonucleotide nucleotidyltransferase [Candidatus Magasanikbacteria bacterium]|nr:polyribonucleotide nucleotidyltransferase [Candidatus Magasanikbacteria bacterium]